MDSWLETVSDSRDYPAAGTKQACLCGRKCRSGSESEFPARDLLRFISICIWIYEKADPEKKVCSGDRISLVRTSMLSCICCTDSRSAFLYQRVRSVFESGFLRLTVFGADPAQGKRKIDLKKPTLLNRFSRVLMRIEIFLKKLLTTSLKSGNLSKLSLERTAQNIEN